MELVKPSMEYLASYREALLKGWSPDNVRGRAAAEEQLERIAADPRSFLAGLEDPEGKGPPVRLPDGSLAQRLPGFARWMWDGEFCGSIGLRWQPGTNAIPAHVLGHTGFSVVPWKRGNGYAAAALRQLMPLARAQGLKWLEITTDPDNMASQRTIQAAGGTFVERFKPLPSYGLGEKLRYRLDLEVQSEA
jgi:predicted acetyltransferase